MPFKKKHDVHNVFHACNEKELISYAFTLFTRLYGSHHTSEVSDTKENECEVQRKTLDAGEELELYIQKLKTPVPLPAQTSLFNVCF